MSETTRLQNVELKAELRDPELAQSIAMSVGAVCAERLVQTDTYFRLAAGRLKRRETVGRPTEYIYYSRENMARARLSRFTIYSEARAKERFGSSDLPVWVVVRKTRQVLLLDNIRVHLDQVEELGDFVELEALVSPRCTIVRCHNAVRALREALTPALGEAISLSYSDLLAAERERHAAC